MVSVTVTVRVSKLLYNYGYGKFMVRIKVRVILLYPDEGSRMPERVVPERMCIHERHGRDIMITK